MYIRRIPCLDKNTKHFMHSIRLNYIESTSIVHTKGIALNYPINSTANDNGIGQKSQWPLRLCFFIFF